jgi:hypothetical protein
MNHQAILKAYPNVVTIDDEAGAVDFDGKIVDIDVKKLAVAEKQLEAERLAAEETFKKLRASAEAKLLALGLTLDDLKALGL